MRALGDKVSARRVAIAAGVPVIPATEVLGDDMDEVSGQAGGDRLSADAEGLLGRRRARHAADHGPRRAGATRCREGRREAEAAFGNGEGYLEKMILRARHVEVQILGDKHGNIYHLCERDCSVQRRNQKVVERAPAPYLTAGAARRRSASSASSICAPANYECAGTVEFLMDMDTGKFYFIEVNPRIQVEHTVTEEVTGIDIVQAQILIAEGKTLAEADRRGARRTTSRLNGHAIQCRITTEDPQNNFIPDYGRITAYRGATGIGIRLDGGTAYSGAVITRYYDSLLEKVTAWAPTPEEAIARMDRALREFRIRGVATNIAFVENLLKHPTFLRQQLHDQVHRHDAGAVPVQAAAGPGDEDPHLYRRRHRQRPSRDARAGRSPPAEARAPKPPRADRRRPPPGTRSCWTQKGPQAVADWMLAQKQRADHRHHDARRAPVAAGHAHAVDRHDPRGAGLCREPAAICSRVECWGGATFDVAYRFLQECPWQRLRDLRAAMPNLMTADAAARRRTGSATPTIPTTWCSFFVGAGGEDAASTCSASSTASTGSRTCASRWTR